MDLTEHRILGIYADLEVMRSALAVLCVYALPDDVLDALIEDLDVPEIGSDPFTQATNAAAERFSEKLAHGRARKRGGR